MPHTTTSDSDSNDNENEMENRDAAKSLAEYKTDLVVKLIDNKWKHMERKLSAAQRDVILLEEAREDWMFHSRDIYRPFGRLVYRFGCPNSDAQISLFKFCFVSCISTKNTLK